MHSWFTKAVQIIAIGSLGACGGGGGGGSDNPNACVRYAEDLCDRIGDCRDASSETKDRCFGEIAILLDSRGETEASCQAQNDIVSDLSCGQLESLANARTFNASGLPPEVEEAIFVATEATDE